MSDTIKIDTLTEDQAFNYIKYETGLVLMLWAGTHTATNDKYQVMVCSYVGLPGYKHRYQVAVYMGTEGKLIRRFNIV